MLMTAAPIPVLATTPLFLSESLPFGLNELGIGAAALFIVYQLVTKVIVPGYEARLQDFRDMMDREDRQEELIDEAIHVLKDAVETISREEAG